MLSALAAATLLTVSIAQENAQEVAKKSAESGSAAVVAKARVPFLRPEGAYADLPEMAFGPMDLLGGGGSPPKAFYPFVEMLDELAKAPEAEVLLDLSRNPTFNLPQVRELERAIGRVRAAGKKVVCYIENAGPGTMQLAALADEVLMADMGVVDMRSPAMSVMHMKDALDLLGVQVEVTRVGEYKGAVEPYMLPAMSDHLRQHYEAMLRSINSDVVRRLATGRKLGESAVRQLQGDRVFTASAAKAAGLVDHLVPWAGAERALSLLRSGEAFELVDAAPEKKKQSRDLMSLLSNMLRASKDEEIEDPQVVVMHLAGEIVDGDKPSPGSMVSGVVVEKLDELAANELVKGVVVRINSPGGSATASEAIRLALQRVAAKKPLVFSMGSVAASGGYWITTIGQPILAEVATITGSIGVFSMRFQPGALMRRLGVHTDIVRLDDGALMDAIDRPWTDASRNRMQGIVDDIYDRFLANVAGSRHMTRDGVDKIAGGRVWSGSQAVELGLVDAIGGLDDALAMVRTKAALPDDVEVVHMPQPKSFADAFFASMFESQAGLGIDGEVLRSVLGRAAGFPGVLAVLRDALAGQVSPRIYALAPMGLRVD